jgi:non-canonical poly(A) RNA polymerase PAPD5/7
MTHKEARPATMGDDDETKESASTKAQEDSNGGLDEDYVVFGDSDDEAESDQEETPQEEVQDDESEPSFNRDTDLPPWMKQRVDYRRINHLVALHNEVVGFCKLMEPHEDEMKERRELVDRFTKLVQATFDNCQVDVFGSQATGLCLPTSDIDIAIQLSEEDSNGPDDEKTKSDKNKKEQELDDLEKWDVPTGSPLHRLAATLRKEWLPELSYLEVIENTRVPLVKFTYGPNKISVDVCFNQKTGPQAAKLMHQYMDALPPLRPLTFVLKYFMAARGLNQPYTGGVGSFLLQMMIVSFLQHRERECAHNRRPVLYNLGALLIEFFELYSTDFNFITTGVSVRFDGFYFPKGATDRKKDFWQEKRPFSLAMENPFELTSDVGISSFRISVVQRSFEVAFKVLLSHVTEPFNPTVSILASILPATEEMNKRSTIRRLKPLQAERTIREPPRKRSRWV